MLSNDLFSIHATFGGLVPVLIEIKRTKNASKLWYRYIHKSFSSINKWNCFMPTVLTYQGEVLKLTKISRSEMGTYLCIAGNGVPPTVSKRIHISVHCKWSFISLVKRLAMNKEPLKASELCTAYIAFGCGYICSITLQKPTHSTSLMLAIKKNTVWRVLMAQSRSLAVHFSCNGLAVRRHLEN